MNIIVIVFIVLAVFAAILFILLGLAVIAEQHEKLRHMREQKREELEFKYWERYKEKNLSPEGIKSKRKKLMIVYLLLFLVMIGSIVYSFVAKEYECILVVFIVKPLLKRLRYRKSVLKEIQPDTAEF